MTFKSYSLNGTLCFTACPAALGNTMSNRIKNRFSSAPGPKNILKVNASVFVCLKVKNGHIWKYMTYYEQYNVFVVKILNYYFLSPKKFSLLRVIT